MKPRRLAARPRLLTAVPCLLAIAACGASGASSRTAAAVHGAKTSQITIPAADRFTPFALVVQRGAQVTFHNTDSDAHSVVSIPGSPSMFNRVIQPGTFSTVALSESGVYHYYCSVHACFDATTGQVEALPNADNRAEPMEGVIVVE